MSVLLLWLMCARSSWRSAYSRDSTFYNVPFSKNICILLSETCTNPEGVYLKKCLYIVWKCLLMKHGSDVSRKIVCQFFNVTQWQWQCQAEVYFESEVPLTQQGVESLGPLTPTQKVTTLTSEYSRSETNIKSVSNGPKKRPPTDLFWECGISMYLAGYVY